MALFGIKLKKYLNKDEICMVDSAIDLSETVVPQLRSISDKIKKNKPLENEEIVLIAKSVDIYSKYLKAHPELLETNQSKKGLADEWSENFADLAKKIADLA